MLESRKSLASYFDEPKDASAVHDWYDQAEAEDAHLASSPEDQGFKHVIHQGIDEMSEDENEFSEDGLGADRLGEWMIHPQHEKRVWVPTGTVDVFTKPDGKRFQEQGNDKWSTDMWGAEDHEARYEHSKKAKINKTNESKEQRAQRLKETKDDIEKRKKESSKIITKARELAYKQVTGVGLKNYFDTEMVPILKKVHDASEQMKEDKKNTIVELKKEKKQSKDRDIALHAMKAKLVVDKQMLEKIDTFLKSKGLENIVGTDLPECGPDGECFFMVLLSFYGQITKQIMTAFLTLSAKKLKNKTPEDRIPWQIYKFVNASYLASNLRKRIVKARYPRKSKKYLPDAEVMDKWAKHFRALERAAFKKLHPNGKIPKRLLDNHRKNQGKKGKKGHGQAHGGEGGGDLVYRAAAVILRNHGNGNNRQKQKKGKGHKHGHKPYNPTYGHPAQPRPEEEQVYDDEEQEYRADYKGPGYTEPDSGYSMPSDPWQGDGRRGGFFNPQPVSVRANRMQRGYFY